jgi:hypothetical protein
MAKTQKVKAPDGREWEIRSYRFRWPRFFPFPSSSDTGSSTTMSTSAGAFLFRLLFGLVFGLVIWLLAALVKALVHPVRRRAWVDATSLKPEAKVLVWKTRRGKEEAVAAEVAQQLSTGSAPQPQNATPLG